MNSTLLTVRADARLAAVLATLPESLQPTRSDRADLVAVDGGREWPERLSDGIAAGAQGLMVIGPCPVSPERLPVVDDVPVVVDTRWAWNQAALASAVDIEPLEDADAFFDARVVTGLSADMGTELLALAALLRTATSGIAELELVRHAAGGLDAVGRLSSGAWVNLSIVRTNAVAPRAWLRVVKEQGSVELTVPDPATALPGTLHVVGEKTDTLRMTQYESAHRTAWRRLHELVQHGRSSTGGLGDLASDLAIVTGVL